jgi:hypothetical protein
VRFWSLTSRPPPGSKSCGASSILKLRDILEEDEVDSGIRGRVHTRGAFGTKTLAVEKTAQIELGDPSGPDDSDRSISP